MNGNALHFCKIQVYSLPFILLHWPHDIKDDWLVSLSRSLTRWTNSFYSGEGGGVGAEVMSWRSICAIYKLRLVNISSRLFLSPPPQQPSNHQFCWLLQWIPVSVDGVCQNSVHKHVFLWKAREKFPSQSRWCSRPSLVQGNFEAVSSNILCLWCWLVIHLSRTCIFNLLIGQYSWLILISTNSSSCWLLLNQQTITQTCLSL